MKQVSTLFLKIIVIMMGIPVLALCILGLPKLANVAINHAAKGETLGYILLSILLIIIFQMLVD